MSTATLRNRPVAARAREAGSFLLEALIAILIVALGVLGSVGLLSRSMQDIDDAKHRGEAAFLASGLIGQMWVSDRDTTALTNNFDSSGTGAGYTEFSALVAQRLPNAALCPPQVTVAGGPIGTTTTNSVVTIQIFWLPPGELPAAVPSCAGGPPFPVPPFHQFNMNATIGANQ
ncbi:MAG: hypothetical protein U1F15_13160 [Burkholderiales bacterium]